MTPYYHCVGRCVRRAWLCGVDDATGANYEHRRAWMAERLAVLANSFAIQISGYALMSNHYHLVVKICPHRVDSWTDREVYERWTAIYSGPPIVHRLMQGANLSIADIELAKSHLHSWRERLCSLSWFMRSLNEHIARMANAEDGCKGHFWEARFKSQALLDESALLAAMTYVDLNPLRAGMANSIPESNFTSAQQRWKHWTQTGLEVETSIPLQKMNDAIAEKDGETLPFSTEDYLELLDVTGRVIAPGKRGIINISTPRLLKTSHLDWRAWKYAVTPQAFRNTTAIGHPDQLIRLAKQTGRRWLQQTPAFARMYRTAD